MLSAFISYGVSRDELLISFLYAPPPVREAGRHEICKRDASFDAGAPSWT